MMVHRLHKGSPMRRRSTGFTMIELMVTVAIVGILATIGVVAYTRNIRKVRASEVRAVIAEIKVKEEAYQMENGTYLGMCTTAMPTAGTMDSGCSEGDYWPTPLHTRQQMDITGAKPARWTALRLQPGKGALYCQYEAIAGAAGVNGNMGAIGKSLYTEYAGGTPPKNWYYVLAQCDWDSDSSVNALYWSRGDQNIIGAENEQR